MKSFICFIIILLTLPACTMGGYIRGASPKYSNLSDKPIYNIKATSGKINLTGWPTLWPGITVHVSNDIKNKNDMYGDVVVSWKNASGKELTRAFKFTKEDDKEAYVTNSGRGLHSIGSYLVFEFTQDDVEYYTSAVANYRERGKRAANIMSDIEYKIDKEKERKKYY